MKHRVKAKEATEAKEAKEANAKEAVGCGGSVHAHVMDPRLAASAVNQRKIEAQCTKAQTAVQGQRQVWEEGRAGKLQSRGLFSSLEVRHWYALPNKHVPAGKRQGPP